MENKTNVIKIERYYDEQYKKNDEIVGNVVIPILILISVGPFILGSIVLFLDILKLYFK